MVTQDLLDVLTFTTGVEQNDAPLQMNFPYEAKPWSGFSDGQIAINCDANGNPITMPTMIKDPGAMNLAVPELMLQKVENFPNPAKDVTTFRYKMGQPGEVSLQILDATGTVVSTPFKNEKRAIGTHESVVNISKLKSGLYYARIQTGDNSVQTIKFIVAK